MSFKVLTIGDPHVTVEELADSNRLIDCIMDAIADCQPDAVVFLGDLFHTHANVRLEVMEFWHKAFTRIHLAPEKPDIYAMVGNHDRSNDLSVEGTAIRAQSGVTVIDSPKEIYAGVWLAPWYPNHDSFTKALDTATSSWIPSSKGVLFCHQTIDGSKYENGFWAPDGISPDLIPFDTVISGHIHTPQNFGKVWYPGAPRWRSASDANVPRAIWCVEIEEGKVISRKAYDTSKYCRVLIHITDVEGSVDVVFPPLYDTDPPYVSVKVDIHGSPEYIANARLYWDPKGVRIATFPVVAKAPVVRESEGISVALHKFVDSWTPRHGTPPEALKRLVQDRIHV